MAKIWLNPLASKQPKHQEFPTCLPSKYSLCPMLLNFNSLELVCPKWLGHWLIGWYSVTYNRVDFWYKLGYRILLGLTNLATYRCIHFWLILSYNSHLYNLDSESTELSWMTQSYAKSLLTKIDVLLFFIISASHILRMEPVFFLPRTNISITLQRWWWSWRRRRRRRRRLSLTMMIEPL